MDKGELLSFFNKANEESQYIIMHYNYLIESWEVLPKASHDALPPSTP